MLIVLQSGQITLVVLCSLGALFVLAATLPLPALGYRLAILQLHVVQRLQINMRISSSGDVGSSTFKLT